LLVVVNALHGTRDWRDVDVVAFWNGELLRHGLKLGLSLLIECLLIDCVDSISCRLPELG
jgi:uncharacterized membrane protein YccC